MQGLMKVMRAIVEAILALLMVPLRFAAALMDNGDRAIDAVDDEADRVRAATAEVDASEREREVSLAEAMRRYIGRKSSLGALRPYGREASAWALAARFEGLTIDALPRDDAKLEAQVLGNHADRLVKPATLADMRRALASIGTPPKPIAVPPPRPRYDHLPDAEMACAYAP